jgi:hypothetical protein
MGVIGVGAGVGVGKRWRMDEGMKEERWGRVGTASRHSCISAFRVAGGGLGRQVAGWGRLALKGKPETG